MENTQMNRKDLEEELDRFFRDNLGEYQVKPSGGIWRNISRRLLFKELIRFNLSNLHPNALIWSAAGIILITGVFMISRGGEELPVTPGTPEASAAPEKFIGKISDAPGIKPSPAITDFAAADRSSTPHASYKSQGTVSQQSSDINYNQTHSPVAVSEIAEEVSKDRYEQHDILSMKLIETDCLKFTGTDCLIYRSGNSNLYIFTDSPAPSASSFFTAGAGVSGEYLRYTWADQRSAEMNYWLQGSLTWHYGRFSLQSGIGFGIFADEGMYHIEYKSYDSVGFFYNVNAYSVDPQNPGQIIYVTELTTLRDSITHVADDRTRNRYTYLQIPLFFGMDLYAGNSFSLYMKAGPAVNFLIGKREAYPVIDYPNTRITRIDNLTPERVTVNWQLMLKLGMEVRLNKRFSFYLEPYYTYYFQPVVQREGIEVQQPLSFGLNTGIFYHFRTKK